MTPQQRVSLGHAVELNLINRKRHPVELVCYTHQLPIGKKRFYMARKLFCQTLIEQLAWLMRAAFRLRRAGVFTEGLRREKNVTYPQPAARASLRVFALPVHKNSPASRLESCMPDVVN